MAEKAPVHLNLRVRGLGNSATVSINERCERLQASGREVFRLGFGQSPFPVPGRVVDALKEHAHQKDYLPVRGLDTLRESVANYYNRNEGLAYTADSVLVGPGSKELMFLLQLVYYGDLVIPTPTWVSYAPQAKIIGREVRMIPTRREDKWRLSPEALTELCEEDPHRPRLVTLNYPSNPTGGTRRRDELARLAEVARKYAVVLLSDEIYGQLDYTGEHVSIARFYPEGTILSGGLSKWCGAGGWRLGTFLFPPELHWLMEAMTTAASETFTSTSAPIQYAAISAYQPSDEIDAYLRHSRRILKALCEWAADTLRQTGADCPQPHGGFYIFPDFTELASMKRRGIAGSRAMCEQLLQDTGVAVLAGSSFCRDDRELTCRIACVDFDGQQALAGAAEVTDREDLGVDFIRQYCPRVVTGIERLADWVSS